LSKVLKNLAAIIIILTVFCGIGRASDDEPVPAASDPEEKKHEPIVKEIIEEFGLWEDETAEARIEWISSALIKAASPIPEKKTIEFILLDEDSINAFALTKGYIFIFRGLVERTETDDQLASVMAHEMTHVLKEHHGKGSDTLTVIQIASLIAAIATEGQEPVIAGQMISAALIESYGRDSEVEADLSGVDLLIDAGFDPIGMIEFFTYMDGQQRRHPQLEGNYFTIHPYAEERVETLREHLESKGYDIPDNIYRLHLALDLNCEKVDEHFECTIDVGDDPTLTLAGDDEDELIDRGFEVITRLRQVFSRGVRDYQVYARERDGTHYLGAMGSTLISVTSDDEKYLEGDASDINAKRLKDLKFKLWKYYINWAI
jgi:hypothetical protein